MSRAIDADALLDEVMDRHCNDCDRRKGIKNGKYRIIYSIGDAPCRACDVDDLKGEIEDAPTIESEIVRCKDCVKHNKGHGYYHDGTVIGIKDCCPLVEIRGMAQGHEFDYQYCAYAERRTDDLGGISK